MSSVGTANPVIIETRRAARANGKLSRKRLIISGLSADLGTGSDHSTGFRDAGRSRTLHQRGTERDVSFRHNTIAPRLEAAFVAQLLGQVMPDRTPRASSLLKAYEDAAAPAPLYDRRL